MTVEDRVLNLEYGLCQSNIPGTMITRVLASREWWLKREVNIAGRYGDTVNGWCLSLGGYNQSKYHFYDLTMTGCVRRAEKFIKENKHV